LRPLRHPGVQRALASTLSAWLRFAVRTTRWTVESRERLEPLLGGDGGVIVCFWHAGIPVSPFAWPMDHPGVQEMRALISRSRDGAFIAEVMDRLGVPAIRGSRAQEAARARDKGGAEALRDMAKWVRGGGAIAITPDGPQGPARRMGEGPFVLGRITRAPVFLLGLACTPAVRLNTWDRMFLPMPFGRGAMVWDGPFHVSGEDDSAATVADWQTRLDAVTLRAEALVR
jgi:lysophospholipid acyltransferase (LPLAT)-like uncharacterized protein